MARPDLKDPAVLLATWFGCGFLKPAPGTWGSLAALPFGLALFYFGGEVLLLAGIMVVYAIGHWASEQYEQKTGEHDAKEIVIDEVAGQWIALIPAGLNPLLILVAFVLFRLFDVLKPWPVSFFDKKVPGPVGVMGDDIVAGLFAAICIYGALHAGIL